MSKKSTAAVAAKPAAKKVAVKSAAAKSPSVKSAPVKKANVADTIVATLTASAPVRQPSAEEVKKAEREAERAKRFPTAAKQEAAPAAKADKPAKPKVFAQTVEFVKRSLPKGTMVNVIAQDARPVSGANLAAHTHAAMMLLGMLKPECPEVAESSVLSIMGQRAVSYHVSENNFQRVGDARLRLTAAGYSKFRNRVIDNAKANAFTALFIDGKVDKSLGIASGKVYKVGL